MAWFDVSTAIHVGLERSCDARDWVRAGTSRPGFERMEASFGTLAFSPHRHDSYAIGVTSRGVQSFCYRGRTEHSLRGCAFVIHPDETHDGRPGTDEGYGYRILYVAPHLIADALSGRLPFWREAVTREARLRHAILAALDESETSIEDLQFDAIVTALADALAAHDPACRTAPDQACARAVRIARDALDDAAPGAVSSAALERLTGLSRFALTRHFQNYLGTSPHRYATMRRLERVKRLIGGGATLAGAAAATGFADQSHMTRQFRRAYGLSPGQWRALARRPH